VKTSNLAKRKEEQNNKVKEMKIRECEKKRQRSNKERRN
jgi:hypothetical protein